MARVNHVKRAQKDYPDHGIKKGEPYYWWKFRYGGKHFSKTYPKGSQLTQSEFWRKVNELQEREQPDFENLSDTRDEIVNDLDELYNECDEKYNNMPEGLQQGDTGQMLESRRDSVESAKSDIENIDIPRQCLAILFPANEVANEIWQEIMDALGGISD